MSEQRNPFEIQTPGVYGGAYLAEVVAVADPDRLGRVQVRLLNWDGVAGQDGPVWARVAVPYAGGDRGAFMLPDVGDEVLVSFIHGDSRLPVVVGGLWNGNARPPETLGGSGDRVDRWTLVGKAGTRIAIVEETPGEAKIVFSTPGGVSGELTDAGGGKVEFKTTTATVTVEPAGITIQTPAKVKIEASQVEVSAGQVTVNAAMSRFSGVIMCDVLQTNSVISASYTPGAGNVW